MKERPILFGAPMVRAILTGAKTQTRREFKVKNGGLWPRPNDLPGMQQILRNCPHGQPGDRLWVRESMLFDPDQGWRYDADGADVVDEGFGKSTTRCPSIHMPRSCSRITLEITGVRVERLLDISMEDCKAEGIERIPDGFGLPDGRHFHAIDPRQSYLSLWQAINGPGSVELDPWVWVIEFKHVEAA